MIVDNSFVLCWQNMYACMNDAVPIIINFKLKNTDQKKYNNM